MTIIRIARIACFALSLLTLPAHAALPQSASVPGGIAVIPLGSASEKPQAWLGEQQVLVTADKHEWYAVIGLALASKPGTYKLRTRIDGKASLASFAVEDKKYPEQHITLKDNGKVELSPEHLARAEHEIKLIKEYKRHWSDADNTDLAFSLPADGQLSSNFGLRRFFNEKPRSPHAGIDLAVARGTPVKAPAAGTVLAADDYFFNGKTVFLDHGNGLITMYCHLDKIEVQPGQAINKGEEIALSGMTGRATGPHLHWSVILNGAMVDPELLVQK